MYTRQSETVSTESNSVGGVRFAIDKRCVWTASIELP